MLLKFIKFYTIIVVHFNYYKHMNTIMNTKEYKTVRECIDSALEYLHILASRVGGEVVGDSVVLRSKVSKVTDIFENGKTKRGILLENGKVFWLEDRLAIRQNESDHLYFVVPGDDFSYVAFTLDDIVDEYRHCVEFCSVEEAMDSYKYRYPDFQGKNPGNIAEYYEDDQNENTDSAEHSCSFWQSIKGIFSD